MNAPAPPFLHTVSLVVPVYRGAQTLAALVAEVAPLVEPRRTPGGHDFRVTELILVHDDGPDDSPKVMKALAAQHPFVRTVWLSRNYGQHPASLAGMASSMGEWVVTLDEDGQFDPAEVPALLDTALEQRALLVYGIPRNAPSHGVLRNLASAAARRLFGLLLGSRGLSGFSSFRLVSGQIARSLAAYCGNGVYLDVALAWVVGSTARCPITSRTEGDRVSGYTFATLFKHFWRMVLTSGTRPLQMIAGLGLLSVLFAGGLGCWALYDKLTGRVPIAGWTSLVIIVAFFSGCILFSLGVIAEYLGLAVGAALGKPSFLVLSRPARERPGAQ